ncbi:MAG: AraC family transcriptional regulator [Opitutales bacterium]|nr:AraC family transcriptional regulator [Opitutales bacterium]
MPDSVVQEGMRHALLKNLIPVSAGFFPHASGHHVERIQPLPELILMACVAGRGWVRIGEERTLAVEPDSLVLIPDGLPHAYGADFEPPWSIHWVHLRGENLAAFKNLFADQPAVLKLPAGVLGGMEFSKVHERLQEDYTLSNLLSAAAQVRLILAECYRLQARGNKAQGEGPVERTLDWMRNHIHRRCELPDLARLGGLSVARYSSLFKEQTGYPPMDYFIRLKIQQACWLLDTTTFRVSEVANAVGYEDSYYFSRLFRRIMGKSPRAYRAVTKG